MQENTVKSVYVFIAGGNEELTRYPGGESGFCDSTGSRVACRYRPISENAYVFVLGNFIEKEKLSSDRANRCSPKKGWCVLPDEAKMFVVAIVGMVDRALRLDRERTDDYELFVFAHMSGLGIELDRTNNPHDAVQLLEAVGKSYKSNGPCERLLPPKVHFYAISTTSRERLDLTAAKIRLPETEDEMKMLVARCAGDDNRQAEIYDAFVKKWNGSEDGQ